MQICLQKQTDKQTVRLKNIFKQEKKRLSGSSYYDNCNNHGLSSTLWEDVK